MLQPKRKAIKTAQQKAASKATKTAPTNSQAKVGRLCKQKIQESKQTGAKAQASLVAGHWSCPSPGCGWTWDCLKSPLGLTRYRIHKHIKWQHPHLCSCPCKCLSGCTVCVPEHNTQGSPAPNRGKVAKEGKLAREGTQKQAPKLSTGCRWTCPAPGCAFARDISSSNGIVGMGLVRYAVRRHFKQNHPILCLPCSPPCKDGCVTCVPESMWQPDPINLQRASAPRSESPPKKVRRVGFGSPMKLTSVLHASVATPRRSYRSAVASAASGWSKSASATSRLLEEGPQDMYAKEKASCGDESCAGDTLFRHEYTQCLLDMARTKVKQFLSQQPGPVAKRFLLCVRTYGRAKPECGKSKDEDAVFTWVRRSIRKNTCNNQTNKAASRFVAVLQKLEINDAAKLFASLRQPAKLFQRIQDQGGCKVRLETLERMRVLSQAKKKVKRWKDPGILQLTLSSLERAMGAEAHTRCIIIVSHEDKDFVDGRYSEALAGTPWLDRIVVGVKGAHHQVRFIEEAAPLGTHIIIADDNIETFVAEVAQEKLMTAGSNGGRSWTRTLEVGQTHGPLDGTGLLVVPEPESELRRFIRGACPALDAMKKTRFLEASEAALRKRGIDSPPKFIAELVKSSTDKRGYSSAEARIKRARVELDKLLGGGLVKRILSALQAQAFSGRLPPARMLVERRKGQKAHDDCTGTSLLKLIARARQEMDNYGANLWSVNTSQNEYFMHKNGARMRDVAKKYGVFEDATVKLGLIYGAFFGFKVLRDPSCYTRFGQVKDDVERTLRYWHRDGVNLRFIRYAVVKHAKPGMFKASKGGISAGSSEAAHAAEGRRALQAMLSAFAWRYAKFPTSADGAPAVYSDCGLVWLTRNQQSSADADVTEAPAAASGPPPARAGKAINGLSSKFGLRAGREAAAKLGARGHFSA